MPEKTKRRRSRSAKPPTASQATKEIDALVQRAPAQRKKGHLSQSYARIVEQVFDMPDPDLVFTEVRTALKLESALTPTALQVAINQAERQALLAHQLFINAKADHERMNVELEYVLGAMREVATRELQDEKDAGERSKSITEADVRARAARMYPDEWTESNGRAVKAKGTIDHIQRLSELWKKRRETLQAMIHAGR